MKIERFKQINENNQNDLWVVIGSDTTYGEVFCRLYTSEESCKNLILNIINEEINENIYGIDKDSLEDYDILKIDNKIYFKFYDDAQDWATDNRQEIGHWVYNYERMSISNEERLEPEELEMYQTAKNFNL